MPKSKASELLRRIMGESDAGDPLWKRQTAACVVLGVGLVPAAPDILRWLASFFH